jgi:hypothetical protein
MKDLKNYRNGCGYFVGCSWYQYLKGGEKTMLGFDKEIVEGIICNPICVGITEYLQIVPDETWANAAGMSEKGSEYNLTRKLLTEPVGSVNGDYANPQVRLIFSRVIYEVV